MIPLVRQAAPLFASLVGLVVGAVSGCGSLPIDPGPAKPRGTAAGPKVNFTGEPDIRVRVRAGTSKVEVAGPTRLTVRPATTDPGQRALQVEGPITVVSGPEGVRVVDAQARPHVFPFATDVEILASDKGEASLRVGGVNYPGFLTIKPAWSASPNSFDVLVTMPVESYLPGVLTHELFKDWPRQTFECQAVAARTYALHERARARAEGRAYDVEDTTADQVYGGATGAKVPNEAARATRGWVLTSDERLIRAYYSSTCGGRPNSASKVWQTGPGYEFNLLEPLQGRARQHYCQSARLYRWEVSRSDDDVNKRLRAWGKAFKHEVANLTRLRAVQVAERNKAERPVIFALTDQSGREYRLTSEELRMGLNQSVPGLTPITNENRVNSGDLEMEIWASQVRIRGRGWGHGVGMCQWCAKGMADAGLDWRAMVRDFYPGAEVVKAY
jgi:stage II sporulation protein D